MELDFVIESKGNIRQPQNVQLGMADDYTVDDNLMVLARQPLQQISSIFIPILNSEIRLQTTFAKLCLRTLISCQHVAIQLQAHTNQIYECLNAAALIFLSRYKHLQTLVIVKDQKHIPKLISHLHSEYNFDWRSSNNYNNNIAYFSYFKVSEVPTNINLLIMYGSFTTEEVNKMLSKNITTLLVLTSDINIKNIQRKFTIELIQIGQKILDKYRQQYQFHHKKFDKCQQDLYCVSKIVEQDKIVLTTKNTMEQVRTFLKNNCIDMVVMDVDSCKESDGECALAYGVHLPQGTFQQIVYFGETIEKSLYQTKFNVGEQSYFEPSSFFESQKKQIDLGKKNFMKKPKEAMERVSIPRLEKPINIPISQVELLYNRTWVRLITQKFNQVKTPVVVMHAQNVRPPVKYNSIKAYIDNTKPVHINRQKQSDLRRLVLINQQLTQGCFNEILAQIFKEKQKDRDFRELSFYQCQPIKAIKILEYISRSSYMNRIDSLYQIIIVFSDENRMADTLLQLLRK